MADVTLDEVFDALDDLDYPASKENIVRHAEQRGAGEEVLRTLRALPLGEYTGRAEVARSVDTAESGAG
jgi:hypothetical protein